MITIPSRFENSDFTLIPPEIKAKFEDIFKTKKGIYLYGEVGTGKTYILYAICKELYKRKNEFEKEKKFYSNYNCSVWNTTNLLREIKNEFDNKRSGLDSLGDCMDYEGILMLDDVGSEKLTDWVKETFYLLINSRYEKNLLTIITGNFSLQDLADRIGDRTASRIVEMCDVVELLGKDRRMIKPNKIQVKI